MAPLGQAMNFQSDSEAAARRPSRRTLGIRPAYLSTAQSFRSAGERKTASQSGFTLLELLVVLAILGLLIGLVAPRVMTVLGSSKEKVARIDIERLAADLDMYKLDVGAYPTTEQGLQALITQPPGVAHWSGPYLKGDKLPQDPWGHPFAYRSPSQRPGHEFDLYSLGPNGEAGAASAAIYNQ